MIGEALNTVGGEFRVLVLEHSLLIGILIISWAVVADHGNAGSYPVVMATPLTQSPFDYVLIIAMNNASTRDVYGNPAMPYLNSLANKYGFATNYIAVAPIYSVPNYLALTGGSTFGVTTDCYPAQCSINAVNIVDRVEGAGLTWKAWAEDYPVSQGCSSVSSNAGYISRHFPFVYFQDIVNNPERCKSLLKANSVIVAAPGTETDDLFLNSLSSTSSAANYMWLTPNQCDDGHDCPLSTGDKYLSQLVPKILSSNIFTTQKAALFVTFAEGISRSASPTDYVPAIWAGPIIKTGFRSSNPYSHYSLLKTIETAWGLSSLTSKDGSAASMNDFLVKPLVGFTYAPSDPVAGENLTFTATASGGTAPYSLAWTFGDGVTGAGNPTAHEYSVEGSYNVTLKLTDSNGKAVTASNTVYVAPVPPPLSVEFTFTPATPEGGQTVTFTATRTGGLGKVSYSWNFGESSPAGPGNPATHVYANTGGIFDAVVTATDENGATAARSRTVVVAPRLQVMMADGTPNPTEVGISVSLSATTSGGVGSPTFSWDFDDGSSPGSGNRVNHTYTVPRTHTVTVTVTDRNGVTASGTVSEAVNARFALAPTANPNSVTTGQKVSLDAGVTDGVTPVSCSWDFGDAGTASGCTATHTYATAGPFTATLAATDALGVTVNGAVNLTVTNLCSADFTWGPSSPEGGILATFTGTTANCFSPVTFSWNFGDGNTGSGSPSTHTYRDTGGSFNVTLTATDSNSATAIASRTVVIAARLSHATFSSTPTSLEVGVSISFYATQSGGLEPYTYSWNFGDGSPVESGNLATHTYNAAGTVTVTVTVTDSNSVTESKTVTESVNPAPSVNNPTASPNPTDVGVPVDFSTTVWGGVGALICNWSFGDSSSATGCSTSHLYVSPGPFYASVTVTDGLSITSPSKSVTVTVNDRPTVNFAFGPSSPFAGDVVTFTAIPTEGNGPFSFSWDLGDGFSASENPTIHAYDLPGNYDVTVTVTDNAGVTAIASYKMTVLIPPLAGDFTFSPASPSAGQSVNFTASATGGLPPYNSLKWRFGDGSLEGTGNPATHAYATAMTFTVTLTFRDARGTVITRTHLITIGENKPPIFSNLPTFQTATVGQPLAFTMEVSDPEGGPVSITVKGLPAGASFDASTGQLSWTPTADQTGNYSITFTATEIGSLPTATSQTTIIQVKSHSDQLCRMCSRSLGFPLDDRVMASVAFLGLISSLVGTIIAAIRDSGESDTKDWSEKMTPRRDEMAPQDAEKNSSSQKVFHEHV